MADKPLSIDVAVIRTAVADLWANIGCGCCCSDTTDKCYERLAQLLEVPEKQGRMGGYEWDKYETTPEPKP